MGTGKEVKKGCHPKTKALDRSSPDRGPMEGANAYEKFIEL